MVCQKCVQGAFECPGKTTTKQYDKFSMKGQVTSSMTPSKSLNFKKRPSAFGCSLRFYKYRYFADICREIPFEAKRETQSKIRVNIQGGLHPYQSESTILLDE